MTQRGVSCTELKHWTRRDVPDNKKLSVLDVSARYELSTARVQV
jgi:hypothetical protein